MSANYGARVTDISDGTSNTVLLDELRVGMSSTDVRGTWAMGQVGASISAGAGRLNVPYPNANVSDNIQNCSIGTNASDPSVMACGSGYGNQLVTSRSRVQQLRRGLHRPVRWQCPILSAMASVMIRPMASTRSWPPGFFYQHAAADGQTVSF